MKSKPIRFPLTLCLILLVISPVIYAQTSIHDFAPNTQLTVYSPQPARTVEPSAPISVYYGRSEAAIVLAAQDLQEVLISKGHSPVTLKSIADLSPSPEPLSIVIAKDNFLAKWV